MPQSLNPLILNFLTPETWSRLTQLLDESLDVGFGLLVGQHPEIIQIPVYGPDSSLFHT